MNMTFLVATKRQLLKGAAVLLTLLVLLALGSPTAAFAEDRGNQRPEGSWLYTVSIPTGGDPFVFLGTETYAPGGGYSEADQLSFMTGSLATAGHGEWKSIGKDKFLLTYVNLTYDGGNATGSSRVRQVAKLSGNTYSGSGDYVYYRTDGTVAQSGTFTITAKRIRVEAPQN
jgi:hypothetical protein